MLARYIMSSSHVCRSVGLLVRLSVCHDIVLQAKHSIMETAPNESQWFSDAKDIGEISMGLPLAGRQIHVGRLKSVILDQYLAISQKQCKFGT